MLAPSIALAQPSDADREEASGLVQRGDAASNAGEHEVAAQLYQRAYKLDGQPAVLSKVADEYYLMKRLQWALTYYCQYIAIATDDVALAEAKAQARAVHVELGRSSSSTDEEVCHGQAAAAGVPSTPGPSTATAATEPPEEPSPSNDTGVSPLRIASLGLAGLGVVALGIGVYYGLEARAIDNEITNHPVDEPWPVDLRAREARGESYNRRAIALMAGGGGAIVIGVAAFFVLRQGSSSPDAVSVAPVIAPDIVGFAAAGRF